MNAQNKFAKHESKHKLAKYAKCQPCVYDDLAMHFLAIFKLTTD